MAAKFVQGGVQALLETFFRGGTVPAHIYVGLAQNATLNDNDAIGAIVPLSNSGYAPVELTQNATGFPTTHAVSTNAWELVAAPVVFTNNSGVAWTAANSAYLYAHIGSVDVLIAWMALSTARTLAGGGDTETVTFTSLKLTGGA